MTYMHTDNSIEFCSPSQSPFGSFRHQIAGTSRVKSMDYTKRMMMINGDLLEELLRFPVKRKRYSFRR